MIPTNIFHRVFHLAHNGAWATGTILHVAGREYLATAKHFAELLSDQLQVYFRGAWVPVDVNVVGHSAEADVSVLALAGPLVPENLFVEMKLAGLTYGQDVYFMGFPFGLRGIEDEVTRNFPIPFVKKAIVANFETPELGADFWLDGHNNVGFSGGPIISMDANNPANCTIRGFVCGYYTSVDEIDDNTTGESANFRANTGLILAAKVERALDLIAANPIGPLVQPPFRIYPLEIEAG